MTASSATPSLSPQLQAAFFSGALADALFTPLNWAQLMRGKVLLTEPTLEFMQGVFVSELQEEACA